jgi:hypothetical protein
MTSYKLTTNRHPLAGQIAPTPPSKKQKRGARMLHVAKAPVWKYDDNGRPQFSHFREVGGTYRKPQ